MTDATRKAAFILKERLDAYREAILLIDELKKVLKESSAGIGVSEITHKIEGSLQYLTKLQNQQLKHLKSLETKSVADIIDSEPMGHEKDALIRLMRAVSDAEEDLKKGLYLANELLNNNNDFILFQLNVISKATAEHTYSPSSNELRETRREIKMFDADV